MEKRTNNGNMVRWIVVLKLVLLSTVSMPVCAQEPISETLVDITESAGKVEFAKKSFVDIAIGFKDYLGFRCGTGRRLGGYFEVKYGFRNNKGTIVTKQETKEMKYEGKIRGSYTAGVLYRVMDGDLPLFLYGGAGYGQWGYLYSDTQGAKSTTYYCSDYSEGVECDFGAGLLFNRFTISAGLDFVFGKRVAHDIDLHIGICL